jgi:hypothetical protein
MSDAMHKRLDPEMAYYFSRFNPGLAAKFAGGTEDTRCNRPFPTRPKLAPEAIAIRVSWNGDQATEK